MDEPRLGFVESKFADIIWAHAPLSSRELVTLAKEELSWTKSTTYTVLRRLCQRGIFQNEGGLVRPLMSREDFQAQQSRLFVQETFEGSLPAFVTAFTRQKKLSEKDIAFLEGLIRKEKEGR